MIQRNAIVEWREKAPWKDPRFVEQDLVISRALVSIFQNEYLKEKLAFRGGTAIYKLFLTPPARYSEDIDFVQIDAEPIGQVLDKIKAALSFLGDPKTRQKANNNVLVNRDIHVPTRTEYARNLENKMADYEFRRDLLPFLAQGVEYDIDKAYKVILEQIVELI